MRQLLCVATLASLCACGGGDSRPPTQPSTPPAPQPSTWTIAGSVVDTLTSQPVAGATLSFAGQEAIVASNDGAWELRGTGASQNQQVTISAPGYVTRETTVRGNSGGRSDVRLDLIPDRAPFVLDFFRQFVRNGQEQPDALRSLRRWTTSPNFYVEARNPRSRQPLAASEIAAIERAIREAVPQVTGGQFSAGAIEIGSGPPMSRSGYIDVIFVHEPDGDFCADAFVGANPGLIRINYERCPSSCGAFAPETLVHEVGHAMGFWHTAGNGVMNPNRARQCSNLQFGEAERLHAMVAYARPPGNLDVDRDPASFAAIQIGDAPRISCRMTFR